MQKKLFVKLLLFLFLLPIALCAKQGEKENNHEKELTDAVFPRTDPKIIGKIYQMLELIDRLFTQHQITYWIDGGTVLGAVRHGGMIPWDDDADLIYHVQDENRILALAEEFASHGFYLKKEHIIRLYPSKTCFYPFIDLAGNSLFIDNTFRFDLAWARAQYHQFYWMPDEVNSLIRIKFGPLMLNAPNQMMRYLRMGYGEDCMTQAIYQNLHHPTQQVQIREKVQIIDYSPAKYEIEDL